MTRRSETPAEVRAVANAAELEAALSLRTAIWRSMGFLSQIAGHWQDEHDAHAHHVVALLRGEVVGSARVCVHDALQDVPDAHVYSGFVTTGRVASFNRLVVQLSARGLGLARRLDDYRLDFAKRAGCSALVVNVLESTGMSRVRALEQRGFIRLSAGFERDIDERGKCLALYLHEP